jgi:uncharacterized cupredoxin-like copper-binding protein
MAVVTDEPGTPSDAAPAEPPPRPGRYRLGDDLQALRPMLWAVGALIGAIVVTIALSLVLSAKGPAGDIAVTETNYRIEIPTTLRAGHHTIALTNNGTTGHELLLFRTSLPANALPVDANGNVIEDSPQLDKVLDSGNALKPGGTQSLPVTLTPGHYAAVCNLPAHYRLGMYVDVTVTG